ncbi:YceD family protein [Megalodesulfovibrio gigas]|nr:DUF177 domain-containing protein [Megalodesulfovibrio gigas]
MPCRMGQPLRADLHLTVHDALAGGGVHIRGKMSGSVLLTCDRCAEDAEAVFDVALDDYEALEGDEEEVLGDAGGKSARAPEAAQEDPVPDLLRQGPSGLEFDVQGYLWQQFMLALPTKPLCAPQCKGLCPHCGTNRNVEQCHCQRDEGDSRLAVLRQLKRS